MIYGIANGVNVKGLFKEKSMALIKTRWRDVLVVQRIMNLTKSLCRRLLWSIGKHYFMWLRILLWPIFYHSLISPSQSITTILLHRQYYILDTLNKLSRIIWLLRNVDSAEIAYIPLSLKNKVHRWSQVSYLNRHEVNIIPVVTIIKGMTKK